MEGVKSEPSLGKLAKNSAPTPKQVKVKTPSMPTKKEAPRKNLTSKQAQYAYENLPGGAGTKDEAKLCTRLWTQIEGYERHFGDLDYTNKPPRNAGSVQLQAFLDGLSGQLGDTAAVLTMKHLYILGVGLAVKGNYVMNNPLGINCMTLPEKVRKDVMEDDFLDREFKELAILHPELCHPGPFLRILLQTVNMVKDVHAVETRGGSYSQANTPVDPKLRKTYDDL